jgi:hypothetical protein
MNQPAFTQADIHKTAKINNIQHPTFKLLPGLQVFQSQSMPTQNQRPQVSTRVTTRLNQRPNHIRYHAFARWRPLQFACLHRCAGCLRGGRYVQPPQLGRHFINLRFIRQIRWAKTC